MKTKPDHPFKPLPIAILVFLGFFMVDPSMIFSTSQGLLFSLSVSPSTSYADDFQVY